MVGKTFYANVTYGGTGFHYGGGFIIANEHFVFRPEVNSLISPLALEYQFPGIVIVIKVGPKHLILSRFVNSSKITFPWTKDGVILLLLIVIVI
jgi:hypothetical protein